MTNLNFQYSPIYILLCLALGFVFAFSMYFKEKKFKETGTWLIFLLGAFRLLAVTILSFLLLVPLIKSIFEDVKEPIIVIARDQSSSVNLSDAENADYENALNELKSKLSNDYQVDDYVFSDMLYTEMPDTSNLKSTNLEKVFTSLDELYINQNVGAMIIATDGIFNEGKNPLYINTNISAPLYTIALGDTTQRKDIILRRTLHNKIVFLGDKFSVQIDIAASNSAGETTNLSIVQMNEDGTSKTLQNIPVRITGNDFFTTQEVILEANVPGVLRYVARLSSIGGEVSTINNRKDIFVEVLDARQKILLLANAPHPDVSALKQIVENNKNYEITVQYVTEVMNINDPFDLVIFHNLPSNTRKIDDIIEKPGIRQAARLFFLGNQTNQNAFNNVQSVINLEGNSTSINDVQALLKSNFSIFNISEELNNKLDNYPPVSSPFGTYIVNPAANILLAQKIGRVDTEYPLLAYMGQDGIKTGVFAAEGIWKWRLFNYLQDKNYDVIHELFHKTLQYLTLKEDKRKFRVNATQNIFRENEPIILTAELYNDSYERINTEEVSVTISDSENRAYNFTFTKRNDAYYLNAGQFPSGNYTYTANVNYQGKMLEASGKFGVENIQLEAYDLQARHGFLKSLSSNFGGNMIYPQDISQIEELIRENNQIKPVMYASTRTNKLTDQKWVFFLIFGFLALEWFLRRYFGSY